ncbi:MAG TPA: L-asparaginase, partial [Mesotoga infera]|nr:L-asparaginase [Mesotoga infera]
MKTIIVHGGTGSFKSDKDFDEHRRGVEEAVIHGYSILEERNSSEEAVIAAVSKMEENPTFNCGRGSVLNYNGQIEMDAAIMDNNLNAGAVSGLKRVLHPIEVARAVMEQTDHVLLAGAGLEELVKVLEFPRDDALVVPHRYQQWKAELERIERGEKTRFGKSISLA